MLYSAVSCSKAKCNMNFSWLCVVFSLFLHSISGAPFENGTDINLDKNNVRKSSTKLTSIKEYNPETSTANKTILINKKKYLPPLDSKTDSKETLPFHNKDVNKDDKIHLPTLCLEKECNKNTTDSEKKGEGTDDEDRIGTTLLISLGGGPG